MTGSDSGGLGPEGGLEILQLVTRCNIGGTEEFAVMAFGN